MTNISRTVAKGQKVQYAVVGLGYIAQIAVLPAFQNASNSQLAALVSGNQSKLDELGNKYKITHKYKYNEYDDLLKSGLIDAVYIALPNDMHCDYAIRAAEAGVHVLCEKPMALTENECRRMIGAAEQNDVRLMIAYRLHYEEATLEAIEIVQSGQIGEPRLFESVFSMQVKDNNIRVQHQHGGGTLYDIGIYCINAARNLFRDEPTEVFAFTASCSDPRFKEVDEMTTGVMRFPNDKIAVFTSSFGATDISEYRVVGTKGDLKMEPAYDWTEKLKYHLTVDKKTRSKTFEQVDQFGPEIINFSDCIINRTQPEPSGYEGLADIRAIEAFYQSAATGRPVSLEPVHKQLRPSKEQEIHCPPVDERELILSEPPMK